MYPIFKFIIILMLLIFTLPPIISFLEIPLEKYGIFILWLIALLIFHFFLTKDIDR